MKIYLILLLTTLSLKGLSQKKEPPSQNVYKTAEELNLIDTITWKEIKCNFSFGSTFVSYFFQLDSNNTYKYKESGCVATITLDNGVWRIEKNNILVLKSKKTKYFFDILRYGKFLFYITPEQRLEFVKDFKNEKKEAADRKVHISEPAYTRDDIIA